MKFVFKLLLICSILIFISSCNNSADRFSVLQKCTVLGDESIIYARAHYVKLFYHFNPVKFSDSYQKIKGFDEVTHRNTIDTYAMAVDKIYFSKKNVEDSISQTLLSTCLELSKFSIDFVEKDYLLALNHTSKNAPLTNTFFMEINQIVKFDHSIGTFDKSKVSFNRSVDSYQEAVSHYIKHYRKNIPIEFLNKHKSK